MKDNVYAGSIGFISGTMGWFKSVGLDEAFGNLLLKTIIISLVSTLTGIIVKKLFYWIFPKKKTEDI